MRPGLPVVDPPASACSRRAASDAFHPGLRASTSKGAGQVVTGVIVQIEEAVDLGDGEPFGSGRHLDDGVAGLELSFVQHPHVEARPTVRHEQRRQTRLAHADAEPVARHARLRHLEEGIADAVPVPHAHLVVGQAVDREVLAEVAGGEIGTAELFTPVPVRVQLVHQDGAMLAAVALQVALAVTVDVQPAHHATALDRRLPDPGVDGGVVPRHVDRESDVDGHQRRHGPRHRTTLRPTAIWSLCVSNADLVTHILDIENLVTRSTGSSARFTRHS